MCIVDHLWLDKRVICFTEGRNIIFYDCEKMTNIGSLVGHLDVDGVDSEFVLCLKKNKLENYIVSAGDDKSVFAWDVRTYKPINWILAHSSAITSLDIFADSSLILTTSDEGYRYVLLLMKSGMGYP